jgi:hypothetical protein
LGAPGDPHVFALPADPGAFRPSDDPHPSIPPVDPSSFTAPNDSHAFVQPVDSGAFGAPDGPDALVPQGDPDAFAAPGPRGWGYPDGTLAGDYPRDQWPNAGDYPYERGQRPRAEVSYSDPAAPVAYLGSPGDDHLGPDDGGRAARHGAASSEGPATGRVDGPATGRVDGTGTGWSDDAAWGRFEGSEPLIDLSAPRAEPVTHRGRRHRLPLVVIAAALSVVAAGGAGYALLRGDPDQTTASSAPGTVTSAAPDSAPGLGNRLLPDGDPVATTAPAPPAATPTARTATSAPAGSATTAPHGSASAAPSSAPTTATTSPAASAAPSPPTSSPTPPAPVAIAPATPLTAAYSFTIDDDALTGYVGSVRVANPRSTAASWSVQLTVRGGDRLTVESGDVTASRDGVDVTFRPSGDAEIPARGSVTFSFAVNGTLDALPSRCAVNGKPCS